MLAGSAGFLEFAALYTALLSLLLSEVSFWEGPELTQLIVLERLALTLPLSLQLAVAVSTWPEFMVAHTALAFALASLEGLWPLLFDAAVPVGGTSVVCWDAVDWMKMLIPSSGGTGTTSSAFEFELMREGGSTGNR